jgi:hypothetical protein
MYAKRGKTMQNNDLEQKIAALPFESMKELKALWQSYFNEPAPVFNKATLVQKLAYRMQELEYGGLKPMCANSLRIWPMVQAEAWPQIQDEDPPACWHPPDAGI